MGAKLKVNTINVKARLNQDKIEIGSEYGLPRFFRLMGSNGSY